MRELRLLIWLTQLGLSAAIPIAGCILLGVWLHNYLGWGLWTIPAGLILGLICGIQGFRNSLKAMEKMSGSKKSQDSPPESFYHHH